MKRIALLSIMLIAITKLSFAQQTVTRSAIVNGIINENFSVLKTDRKVRQGEYTATFNGNTIARGNYTDGKRTGLWNFYAAKNKLVQTFNYDHNKLTFLDSADVEDEKYIVESSNRADVITAPIKIGGKYGLVSLTLSRTELQKTLKGDLPGALRVNFTHTLVVNEQGIIVDHIVKAAGDNHMEKTYHLSDAALDPDLTRFIPATVNGKPVMSKVIVITTSATSGVITRTY